jgi:hypothetical protein
MKSDFQYWDYNMSGDNVGRKEHACKNKQQKRRYTTVESNIYKHITKELDNSYMLIDLLCQRYARFHDSNILERGR